MRRRAERSGAEPLRRLVLALALALAAGPALGQEAGVVAEGDRTAIVEVIRAQFAAFRRDDGSGAFAHASPGIRAKFGTPEIFMDMVRTGYPAVYRPRGVAFLGVELKDGRPVQAVRLIGADGRALVALYEMERQPDGSWKIAGVYLIPLDDRTS